jgi:hypothetical protein
MAAGQGAGAGDFPEDQERALIEVIPVHGGHASGMLAGGGVGHGGNKDALFRNDET